MRQAVVPHPNGRRPARRGPAGVGAPARVGARWARLLALMAGLVALVLSGCSYHYIQGQRLEAQERWEEAAIEYRLAYLDDPDDPDYQEALERTNKRVARDNYERYQAYLASKEFLKAYDRLSDAARQDPAFEPVQEELGKWMQVLLSGHVRLSFESLRSNLSLVDEIRLFARINTPNAGEVIEAEIDIDTGIFFVEHLLYDPPEQLLARYTLNSLGVSLVKRRSDDRQFTSTQAVRLVNFRTPVLEDFAGRMPRTNGDSAQPILEHRRRLQQRPPPEEWPGSFWQPPVNLRYTLRPEGDRILVSSEVGRTDFVPRFLYTNLEARRTFVGFGNYELHQDPETRRWGISRLPLNGDDYFFRLARNIALQPYFFYHEPVLEFVEQQGG